MTRASLAQARALRCKAPVQVRPAALPPRHQAPQPAMVHQLRPLQRVVTDTPPAFGTAANPTAAGPVICPWACRPTPAAGRPMSLWRIWMPTAPAAAAMRTPVTTSSPFRSTIRSPTVGRQRKVAMFVGAAIRSTLRENPLTRLGILAQRPWLESP